MSRWLPDHVAVIRLREYWLAAWSRETGLHWATIHGRLKRGWAVERALTEPADRGSPLAGALPSSQPSGQEQRS